MAPLLLRLVHVLVVAQTFGQLHAAVAKDKATAFDWFRKTAEQGDATAQFNLGVYYMYDQGIGVTKNEAAAAEWFR
jgi:TPR repeat protein